MADEEISPFGAGKQCFRCKKMITGDYRELTKQNKTRIFHAQCFVCNECRRPLDDKTLQIKANKMYCPACHTRLYSPRCITCFKPVDPDELIRVNDSPYHQSCFKCSGCDKPMSPGRHFKIMDATYCEVECALEKQKKLLGQQQRQPTKA